MALEVFFHPLAVEDLDAIDDFIARDSPAYAFAFVSRIRKRCESLAIFPMQGRSRSDIGDAIRLLAFERRVVIAYSIDAKLVTIWRIVSAGQDLDDVLKDLSD